MKINENALSHESASNASENCSKVANATPAMKQFFALKERHPECLLFYRMGDFYELFFDDAIEAAAILDIALTKRGKHGDEEIPMCGVPAHSHEAYLEKLIRTGRHVAVCEQMETPAEAKKRGSGSVVRREVVRIVTPGTLTEDTLLDARRSNYLAAIGMVKEPHTGGNLCFALAWFELSTGEFKVQALELNALSSSLARLDASEILVPDTLMKQEGVAEALKDFYEKLTAQPAVLFDTNKGARILKDAYRVSSLDSFGQFDPAHLAACGALLEYVQLTQKMHLNHLPPPQVEQAGAYMLIDAATQRNLELTRRLNGEKAGSLLAVIDRTRTAPGARLLASRLVAPLMDASAIHARLEAVEYFFEDESLRLQLRELLSSCPDVERCLTRLLLGRGGPRDLQAMGAGLSAAAQIFAVLPQEAPAELATLRPHLGGHDALIEHFSRTLKAECGTFARDGNFVADGYCDRLDKLRTLKRDGRGMIAAMEARLKEEANIPSLKVKFNNVLGYFIEVTPVHAAKVPEHFIHRQTMANALRYTTIELNALQKDILEAEAGALERELEIFTALVAEVTESQTAIQQTARAVAAVDVHSALAALAVESCYSKPEVVKDNAVEIRAFEIRGGRHPVVEAVLRKSGEAEFIANDCALEEAGRLWLLTGPNMAGKSTFLRQNALIILLAQMGGYVPAEYARIGVVDRLFSRVGAADDLARGRSTFMVEMVETAAILNQASARSFVILDEIGRGTATFDGLSLAWAVVEYLHDKTGCRGLFATHYHELTSLATRLDGLACHTMRVKEWKGEIVFLHEVGEGAAERSYGIHVARLAGLPAPLIARATEILHTLEQGGSSSKLSVLSEELPLFDFAEATSGNVAESAVSFELKEALSGLNPDNLSPREAHEILYQLKSLLQE